MKYLWANRPGTYLSLLLGSAFFPVPVLAAGVATAALEAPAVPALMLAKLWQVGRDPSGFLVSEKLDGVRAFWDGQVLRFRSGRVIAAPAWFTAALPATALDGELWLGRGRFDELSGIVRQRVPNDAQWHTLRYMIFDLPGASGSFGERAARMVSVVASANVAWLQAVEQRRVPDSATLQHQLIQLVGAGGEGLVLHRSDSLWLPGRSDALLKLKPVPDEDARVIAHVPGKGRLAGHMGALLLELPSGQQFALGTGFTDSQRAAPPPVGATVTYRYRDRTPSGLPRFASFLRVREAE